VLPAIRADNHNNYEVKVRMLNDSAGVSVLIITAQEDNVSAINQSLREAGVAAHCTRIEKVATLEDSICAHNPELLLLIAAHNDPKLQQAAELRDRANPKLPLLLVSDLIDEETILTALQNGARDIISINNPARFCAVAKRELHSYRLEKSLEQVMASARQYKQELKSLKLVTLEAIADVQEGIIVNANPAWLELFSFTDTDLSGQPFMDLCSETDRPAMKGALVACQKGKWLDSKLEIRGVNQESGEFPISLNLAQVEHDGEAAIRIMVIPEQSEDDTPQILIEEALQRDQATGFYNRSHFLNTVDARLAKPPAGGVRAIAYIRPDRFAKAVTDIGLIGTEVIITQLAQILREFIQPNDIYGRFGGTIFTVMLERGTMSDVEAWAEQLLVAINENIFDHENSSTVLTCTIGLCEADSAKQKINELLSEAEHTCKQGRVAGGDRIELSESSGAAKEIRQDDSIWVPKIRGAIMENRLRLEHQTIGSLNDDIDNAYDTLVRMLDEDGNIILPGEFMPAAERTGLCKNIDRWIISASISFCAANNPAIVFIRLSRDSLLDETLPDWISHQAQEKGVTTNKLCFEVAEILAAKHMKQTQNIATTLKKLGCKFAIEHFGKLDDSGRLLPYIPMDFVKIDGSLMQGLHKNQNEQTKVKELARQAHELGIKTIAERVQAANTMAVLWQLGISHIQGNYVQSQEIVIEDKSQAGLTTKAVETNEKARPETKATA
jgi:diguanylate cyclase (GGDEF)-like protein